MKKMLLSCLLFVTVFSIANSQIYHYAPNSLNIPALAKRGDVTLDIGFPRGNAQGLELQGAYSPVKHVMVLANYFKAGNKSVRETGKTGTHYKFWEFAVGAYESLPNGAASIVAGFGTINIFNQYGGDKTAEFDARRWFVQPGLTYQNSAFHAGIALRLSYLFYENGNVSYSIEEFQLQQIRYLEEQSPLFLPELGIKLGMHFDPVSFSICIASIFPDTDQLAFTRVTPTLLIGVNFGTVKKREPSGKN